MDIDDNLKNELVTMLTAKNINLEDYSEDNEVKIRQIFNQSKLHKKYKDSFISLWKNEYNFSHSSKEQLPKSNLSETKIPPPKLNQFQRGNGNIIFIEKKVQMSYDEYIKFKALEVENKNLMKLLADKGIIVEQLRIDNDNLRNKVAQLEEENQKLKDRINKLEIRVITQENELQVLTQEKNRRQLLDYVADLSRLFFYYKGGSWNDISEKISNLKALLEDGEIDMQTYTSTMNTFHPNLSAIDLDTLHSIITSRNLPAHQDIRSVVKQQNFITNLDKNPWHEFVLEEKRVVKLMLSILTNQKFKRY